ncbi:MAG: Crp/Fnr family transcriptional regulator [Deltaproteobacteria bacterium]|nr:Crp/Fnr family transcriptional regulator [Deltaproteobacteria bacterium]
MNELIEAAEAAFSPILGRRAVAKGALLLRPGERSTRLFLVRSGLLRSFHVVRAKEVNAHFAFEGGIVGAVDSILYGRESRYGIDALEDTECSVLDYVEVEAFLDRHPEHERLVRQITQFLYADLVDRFEGMLFLSAKERYDHLLARHPGITQRVGLGHIASYLGMTQETLSRVRGGR